MTGIVTLAVRLHHFRFGTEHFKLLVFVVQGIQGLKMRIESKLKRLYFQLNITVFLLPKHRIFATEEIILKNKG
jgi:hypothetical protein